MRHTNPIKLTALLFCTLHLIACGSEPEEPTQIIPDMSSTQDEDMTIMKDMAIDESDQSQMLADMSPDLKPDMATEPEDDMETSKEDMQDMEPMPGCDPASLPEQLQLGVGQGTLIEVPDTYQILGLSNSSALSYWVETDGATRVHLRANYEETELVNITVTMECLADATVNTHTIEVSIKGLEVAFVENWGDANGPVRREHAPFLFHPDDPDALYLYGGLAYRPRQFTVITDFWRFDRQTQTWSEISVQGTPPAVGTNRFVYSERHSAFLTVGGDDILQNIANTDLYRLSRDSVTETWSWSSEPIQGDLGHSLGALVYDETSDRLVALLGFGGIGQSGFSFFEGAASVDLSQDTLSWEAVASASPSPSPRYGFSYFVDPVTERLVVTGGAQGLRVLNPAEDTWAYDWRQNTWSQLLEVNVGGVFNVPGRHSGGRNPCWAFDPVHRRLFVWGGTPDGRTMDQGLYALHLDEPGAARWYEVSREGFPPTRASCSGGYNAATGEIYFGFGNSDQGVYQDLVFVNVHEL